MENEVFKSRPGFCSNCGTILPLLWNTDTVKCYTCAKVYPLSYFSNKQVQYTIHFNSIETFKQNVEDKKNQKKVEDEEEGPIVDRKCPKCGNEKMSYATLQLRSADEGQTVFYTCTKCKYKESENS